MQAFQQRVIDERTELDDRIERLSIFISGHLFRTLPSDERSRLRSQHSIMLMYSNILTTRIDAFITE